jgi:hypothetical protein
MEQEEFCTLLEEYQEAKRRKVGMHTSCAG